MGNKKYIDYFASHHKYSFSENDLLKFRKWFFTQWRVIKKNFDFEGKKLLEIGSGIGGFYSFINNLDYVGLELDIRAVDFSNKYHKTNKFLHMDWFDYPLNKKKDCILAFEVLEHLNDPSSAIKKIYSSLNAGGVFIGTTPFPFRKNITADNTHVYVLHPENWRKLFVEAGFYRVSITPFTFLPFVWRINKYLNIRLPFYLPFKYFISTCLIEASK